MYSRTYFSDNDEKINLPDSYDGVAFGDFGDTREKDGEASSPEQHTHEENSIEAGSFNLRGAEHHKDTGSCDKPERRDGGFLSGFSLSPWLKKLFGRDSFLGLDGIGLSKIGTEELLIIATALFLLFSKDGDKECALILLFLLFVN